jgi:hypothetical protein
VYAHGAKKPRRTIPVDEPPLDCAVDQQSGDLAVAPDYGYRDLYVFKHGRGSPIAYMLPHEYEPAGLGYDNHGNLFAIGGYQNTREVKTYLYELRRGWHHFREVHLGRKYEYFTDVKWDGEYLALLGQEYAYRISLMGKQGRVVQSVRLFGQVWFWIVPTYSQVVSTDGEGSVQITGYPGGTYVKVINVGMPSFPPAVSLAADAR